MKKYTLKAIGISILLILLVLVHNIFSIFLETILGTADIVFLVALIFFMIGAVIFSMVRMIVDKRYSYSMLIVAAGISAFLLINQALSSVGVTMEYKHYANDRQKIVQMFEGGKIKYNGYDQYVKLPAGYARLSKFHGLMMVDNHDNKIRIGFVADNSYFTRHHIVIYVAGDGVLRDNDFGEDLQNIKRINEHWYEATAEVMMLINIIRNLISALRRFFLVLGFLFILAK
jgi:hypothetical protein